MNYRQLADLIPSEYRSEILLTDIINTALPYPENPAMKYLVTVWRNYLEPNLDLSCGQCYVRVLTSWKQIQEALVIAEKENNLLNS